MLGLADLKERVVGMDTTAHALLAEVCIGAYRAHVANTTDGIGPASIADHFLVNNVLLLFALVLKVVYKHLLEACVAVFFDLLADNTSEIRKLTRGDGSPTVALAARQSLLVHLRAVALEACHLFDRLSVIVAWDE